MADGRLWPVFPVRSWSFIDVYMLGWECGSVVRVLAKHVRGPRFNIQYWKKGGGGGLDSKLGFSYARGGRGGWCHLCISSVIWGRYLVAALSFYICKASMWPAMCWRRKLRLWEATKLDQSRSRVHLTATPVCSPFVTQLSKQETDRMLKCHQPGMWWLPPSSIWHVGKEDRPTSPYACGHTQVKPLASLL